MKILNNEAYNDAYSEICGYISIACWFIVLFPQIWINYKRKSGDSLSLTFLYIWVAGDLLNLTGAILQHLLRHIIILGVYYTVTDTILIFQIYYYRKFNKSDEELPLLQTQPNKNKNKNDKNSTQLQFIIVIPILLLCVLTGVVAFSNRQEVKKDHSLWIRKEQMELLPQMFGWISAFLYLGSRIPQILQNYKSKSTEGLSLAMFCFSLLGNLTYCLSVVLHSTDPEFLLINLSWLIGSGGTMIFDIVIFFQFYFYR